MTTELSARLASAHIALSNGDVAKAQGDVEWAMGATESRRMNGHVKVLREMLCNEYAQDESVGMTFTLERAALLEAVAMFEAAEAGLSGAVVENIRKVVEAAVIDHCGGSDLYLSTTLAAKKIAAIAALGQGEAVYQIQDEDGDWFDEDKATYWWAAREPRGTRILYTHAPQPVVPEGFVMVPRDELLRVARMAEGLKRECGMDPESPQAVRNTRYMSISYALRSLAAAPTPEAQPQGEGSPDAAWKAACKEVFAVPLSQIREKYGTGDLYQAIACRAEQLRPKASEAGQGVAYTTGHCESNKQAGGCQKHNLQCGWPDCDRRPIATHTPEGRE